MRIVFAGDIVGNQALKAVCRWIERLNQEHFADFYIVNGENSAEGSGITYQQARQLLDAGVDCITLGNHSWGHWDLAKQIGREPRIVRPANVPSGWPGASSYLLERDGRQLIVLSLLGSVFMRGYLSPFTYLDNFIGEIESLHPGAAILVDFHAEATAEKQALAWNFDGRVAAVLGTHTHVQTADEHILPSGTAYISDVGMCGPRDSVIGMDIEQSLRRFVQGLPAAYRCARSPLGIRAVCLDIDHTGACRYIERIQIDEASSGDWLKTAPLIPCLENLTEIVSKEDIHEEKRDETRNHE